MKINAYSDPGHGWAAVPLTLLQRLSSLLASRSCQAPLMLGLQIPLKKFGWPEHRALLVQHGHDPGVGKFRLDGFKDHRRPGLIRIARWGLSCLAGYQHHDLCPAQVCR